MQIKKYNLYLADVNYENTEEHKIRPVIQINDGLYLPVVAKITSHPPRKGYKLEYAIQDWKEAGLKKPSTIRFSNVFEIEKDDLIKKIGHLSSNDIVTIEKMISKSFNETYINKNAGNIEANIQAFNNATFTGGLMEADSELSTFYYWGPIYLHATGELWSEEEQAKTRAVSREKAICNIKYKFFRKYGRAFNLKDSYLYEEPTIDYAALENPKEDHVEDPKYNFDDIDREGNYMVESPLYIE